MRLRNNLGDVSVCWFQFTHPCGCDKLTVNLVRKIKSFNSRTRVGATAYSTVSPAGNVVSIHAPVWVRPCASSHCNHATGFNSRTRVGATSDCGSYRVFCEVSIHAPVWVRLCILLDSFGIFWFQFTHPCGCDGLTNTV